MNLYPPMLFNRIRVVYISPDYHRVKVRVKKSLLNRNIQRSIFGGTIFSAADPFHAMMYWQIMRLEGLPCEAWLKSAEIRYLKPAHSNLDIEFVIEKHEVELLRQQLQASGKAEMTHQSEILNKQKEVVALVKSTVSLRLRKP